MRTMILLLLISLSYGKLFTNIKELKEMGKGDIIKPLVTSIDTTDSELKFHCEDGSGELTISLLKEDIDGDIPINNRVIFSLLEGKGSNFRAKSAYFSKKSNPTMGHTSHSSHSTHGMGKAKTPSSNIQVDPPKDGHSIGDIFAQLDNLDENLVKVAGEVVKFSPNIMGTNWIHIQDGSGEEGSNNLVVRTTETFSVGDRATFTGKLKKDYELVPGMVYKAIILDGKSTK